MDNVMNRDTLPTPNEPSRSEGCGFPRDLLASYADWDQSTLCAEERARVEEHLSGCEHCRDALKRERAFACLFLDRLRTLDAPGGGTHTPSDDRISGVDRAGGASRENLAQGSLPEPASARCGSGGADARGNADELVSVGWLYKEKIPVQVREHCLRTLNERLKRLQAPRRGVLQLFGGGGGGDGRGGAAEKPVALRCLAGVAAAALLALGLWTAYVALTAEGGAFATVGGEVKGLFAGKEAARQAAVLKTDISQLREQFDRLTGAKGGAKQLITQKAAEEVQRILAQADAYVACPGAPQANLVHAWLLKSDCHGALVEREKEFSAYLAFAENLSSYYNTCPAGYSQTHAELTVPQDVLLTALLGKALSFEDISQYLSAIRFYNAVCERFPDTDYAAYGLLRIGMCYTSYDQPDMAQRYLARLRNEYRSSKYALQLMEEQANRHWQNCKWDAAAEAWLELSQNNKEPELRAKYTLCAAVAFYRGKRYARSEEVLSDALWAYGSFSEKELAKRLLVYNKDVILQNMMKQSLKNNDFIGYF